MKSNKIDEEAALWVIRSQPEPLNTDEQREFEHWLNSDPRHLGAFVRARAVWVDVDRTSALSAPRTAQFAAEERHDTTTTRRRWLLVAAVSSMIFAAVGWWQLRAEVFQTDIGEVRRITLADGSSVMLNTATRAEVRMTSASREVRIVRGEGLFEVAKDAARPFIVRVGDVTVRALGTAFSVRAVDSRIDVTVAEGSVEMSAGNEAVPRSSARLAANDTGTETSRGVQVKQFRPKKLRGDWCGARALWPLQGSLWRKPSPRSIVTTAMSSGSMIPRWVAVGSWVCSGRRTLPGLHARLLPHWVLKVSTGQMPFICARVRFNKIFRS